MLQKTINWLAVIWLVLESGQFFSNQLLSEPNPLFWPFWITLWVAIALVVQVIDLRRELQKRRK